MRVDVLKPDPTRVQERLKELIKVEREAGDNPYISAKKRRRLKRRCRSQWRSWMSCSIAATI